MSGRATNRTGGRPFPVSRHRPTISPAGRPEAIPARPKESDQDPTTGPDPPRQDRKGRSDHRHGPVRDRHDRRTQEPFDPARSSPAARRIWRHTPFKNGAALGGYGAEAMNAALIASMTKLPEQLRKTPTWDRGKELSAHAHFAFETGTRLFFADPHSPWQRPTNENTNGLLRQYFPKGTDLSRWSAEDLEAFAVSPWRVRRATWLLIRWSGSVTRFTGHRRCGDPAALTAVVRSASNSSGLSMPMLECLRVPVVDRLDPFEDRRRQLLLGGPSSEGRGGQGLPAAAPFSTGLTWALAARSPAIPCCRSTRGPPGRGAR